jgi:hypothetical protein
MYKNVHRYLELENRLDKPDFFSRLKIVGDLIIQPIGHLLFWIGMFLFPSILVHFGYAEKPTAFKILFYIVSSAQVVWHCFDGWSKMVEYYNLGTLFMVQHIKYARTHFPFTVNSSKPSHNLFRYAAMDLLLKNVG